MEGAEEPKFWYTNTKDRIGNQRIKLIWFDSISCFSLKIRLYEKWKDILQIRAKIEYEDRKDTLLPQSNLLANLIQIRSLGEAQCPSFERFFWSFNSRYLVKKLSHHTPYHGGEHNYIQLTRMCTFDCCTQHSIFTKYKMEIPNPLQAYIMQHTVFLKIVIFPDEQEYKWPLYFSF